MNHSSQKTAYTGVTLVGSTLYAAASTGIEAYTTSFVPVTLGAGAFTDPNVPAGYTPYGIQSVGQKIYVTFSPLPPASGGYVDVFNTSGKLLLSLQNLSLIHIWPCGDRSRSRSAESGKRPAGPRTIL